MLLTKTILLKWNPSNREHYVSKGYRYTHWHDEFEVKIDDLVDSNINEIKLICDYCNEPFSLQYRTYHSKFKNNASGKHSCENCNNIRLSENKLTIISENTEDVSASNYDIKYKVNIKNKSIYIKQCKTCGKYKEVSCFRENNRSKFIEYSNQCIECDKDFKELNIVKFRLRHIKETSIKMNLPVNMTEKQFERMIDRFDNKCALSESINVICEHFIPVSWGHGGTYEGNVYLLNESLNMSKRDKNPFEWIKDKKVRKKINIRSWNKLIKYLAAKNKLTVEEFKKYIYWCENNKRDAVAVKNDNGKTSLELWKINTLKQK